MSSDALLADTDIEEALSAAYAHAVAATAGYVVALRHFDRDGVDITFEAGEAMRPKIDAQIKATIKLPLPKDGIVNYSLKRRNYDLLRIATQTPRILIVHGLPPDMDNWLSISEEELAIRGRAFWATLKGYPATDNSTSVTVPIPAANVFDVATLQKLMQLSRTGALT